MTRDSFLGSCLPVSMDPGREALETKVLAINPATKQNKLEDKSGEKTTKTNIECHMLGEVSSHIRHHLNNRTQISEF